MNRDNLGAESEAMLAAARAEILHRFKQVGPEEKNIMLGSDYFDRLLAQEKSAAYKNPLGLEDDDVTRLTLAHTADWAGEMSSHRRGDLTTYSGHLKKDQVVSSTETKDLPLNSPIDYNYWGSKHVVETRRGEHLVDPKLVQAANLHQLGFALRAVEADYGDLGYRLLEDVQLMDHPAVVAKVVETRFSQIVKQLTESGKTKEVEQLLHQQHRILEMLKEKTK